MDTKQTKTKRIPVAEQPHDRLYEMKLCFVADAELKELNDLTELFGFREKAVAQNSIQLHLTQTVAFIPDDETLALYAKTIVDGYNNALDGKTRLRNCRFSGYEYLYCIEQEQP